MRKNSTNFYEKNMCDALMFLCFYAEQKKMKNMP